MKRTTMAQHLAELQSKYGDSARTPNQQAGRINLDTTTTPGHIYFGSCLQSNQFPPQSGIVQTKGCIGLIQEMLYKNLLVVGQIGSGKTTLLLRLIHQIATNTQLDIYVVDGKGDEDLALDVANIIYAARKIAVPIVRIGGNKTGAIYNPFSGSDEAIFERLCALAGVHEQVGEATFYKNRNIVMLQWVAYAPQGAPRSFTQLRERLSKDWLLRAYKKDTTTQAEINKVSEKNFEEFRFSLLRLARMFDTNTGIEGFKIEDTHAAMFSLGTQSSRTTSKEFIDMLIEDIKDAMKNRITRPCVWIIDEFLVLGNTSIASAITIGRSFGMGIVLAMQSIDAIKDEVTKDLILTNCIDKIIMANSKPETLVKLGGTRKGIEASIQYDEGEATGMGSARLQDQYLIDPNEVRGLQAGECFLLQGNKKAKLKVSRVANIARTAAAELIIEKQPEVVAPSNEQPERHAPPNNQPKTKQPSKGRAHTTTPANATPTAPAQQNSDEDEVPMI